jgi:hypothetical protein
MFDDDLRSVELMTALGDCLGDSILFTSEAWLDFEAKSISAGGRAMLARQ